MKTNELRIGNYISVEGRNIQVGNIKEDFISCVIVLQESGLKIRNPFISLNDDRVKPIDLTEEILLKCGFKRFPWGLVISKLLFKDDLKCNYLELEIGNGFRVKIKHLHQLQNLYFALTGEELNIKLWLN